MRDKQAGTSSKWLWGGKVWSTWPQGAGAFLPGFCFIFLCKHPVVSCAFQNWYKHDWASSDLLPLYHLYLIYIYPYFYSILWSSPGLLLFCFPPELQSLHNFIAQLSIARRWTWSYRFPKKWFQCGKYTTNWKSVISVQEAYLLWRPSSLKYFEVH